MSKITSKMRFLDESRLSFKIEDGMLQVMDQMESVIGTRPLPIPIDTENMDVEEIYQKAEECGYSIDDMISEIVQDSVIEKREYDAWLSPDLFIFYSPTKGEWVSEPYEGIFAIMKDMYEEDMKEIEMGADSVETENLDCPIEENEDSLITNKDKDPNFDYGDDEDAEDDVDYVSQILGYTPSDEEETEDTTSEEVVEDEDVSTVEEVEVPVEPEVEEVVPTPEVVEEVKLEKKPDPQVQQPKPEVKKENKPQQNNNNNNNQQKKQKNNQPEPQVQQPKQPEIKNENKQNPQNNKGQNNQQNQNVHKNEQKQEKVVSKNEKEKVNMPQNQPNSTKSFAWNDKAKTLRSAVDELNKYKNEVKSNEIAELAKYVVSVIEEKHMDPNNADEKEILYTLALNDKTIIKGLTPIRAGIYKAMLMKELRSLGF